MFHCHRAASLDHCFVELSSDPGCNILRVQDCSNVHPDALCLLQLALDQHLKVAIILGQLLKVVENLNSFQNVPVNSGLRFVVCSRRVGVWSKS